MQDKIKFDLINKNLVIKINCDIDHHMAIKIRDNLERKFKPLNYINIIFDLENVNFMDSSGIGMIIGRYKELEKTGGKVYIINLNPNLSSIIEISGLKKIINFRDDLDSVLKNY